MPKDTQNADIIFNLEGFRNDAQANDANSLAQKKDNPLQFNLQGFRDSASAPKSSSPLQFNIEGFRNEAEEPRAIEFNIEGFRRESHANRKKIDDETWYGGLWKDLKSVDDEWRAGFHFEHFDDISQAIFDGDDEKLDQAFADFQSWSRENDGGGEAHTLVGKAIRGVANMLPAFGKTLYEGGKYALAGGGMGAAGGSVIPGIGTTAGAITGAKVGFSVGSISASYRMAVGDIYSQIMESGEEISKEDAKKFSLIFAVPYTGLDLIQLSRIPGVKQALNKIAVKPIVQKIASNPILRKKLARIFGETLIDSLIESVAEGGQDAIASLATDAAAHRDFDYSAAYEKGRETFKEVLPSMLLMSGVGNKVASSLEKRSKKNKPGDAEAANSSPTEVNVKRDWSDGVKIETPAGVTSQIPSDMQEAYVWATNFSPQDIAELRDEALKLAKKDFDAWKSENSQMLNTLGDDEYRDISRQKAAEFANAYYKLLARRAYSYKLQIADLYEGDLPFETVVPDAQKSLFTFQNQDPQSALQNLARGAALAEPQVEMQNLSGSAGARKANLGYGNLPENTRTNSGKNAGNAQAQNSSLNAAGDNQIPLGQSTNANFENRMPSVHKNLDGTESARQRREVKAKWTKPDGSMKSGFMLAPNGRQTKLSEDDWLLVRTPAYKEEYGDWETLSAVNEAQNMPAMEIKPHEALDKAAIKQVFKSFGEVENIRDGRTVVFPSASAGKIHYHKGFNTGEIIRNFKLLFKTALPIISEKENVKKGHKVHDNVERYNHYLNKFSINGTEYYIRFTTPIITNSKAAANVHSSAISEVSIYKGGGSGVTLIQTPGNPSPLFVDRKLADFFNSVKPEDVKVKLDENGEPILDHRPDTDARVFNVSSEKSSPNQQTSPAKNESSKDLPSAKDYGPSYESVQFKPTLIPNLGLPESHTKNKCASVGEIRRWFAQAFGIPVSSEMEPWVASGGTQGYYRLHYDTVRLSKSGRASLATLFHEMGHALDFRLFNGNIGKLKNNLNSELRDFFLRIADQRNIKVSAYHERQYAPEGFAEFIAEFLLDPEKAKKDCPLAYSFMEIKLSQEPDVATILKKVREMVLAREKASPVDRMKANVVSEKIDFKLPFWHRVRNSVNKMRTQLFDEGRAFADLENKLNKIVSGASFSFDQIRTNLNGGAVGQTQMSVESRQVSLDGRDVGKGLVEILRPIFKADKYEDFRLYLVARRVMGELRKNKLLVKGRFVLGAAGFCRKISGFELRDVHQVYTDADFTFKTVAREIEKFNNNTLQLLVDGGVIGPDDAKIWESRVGYVPFKRMMDDDFASAKTSSDGSPIMRFKGSNREIIDPIQTMIENAALFRILAQKNRVKLNIAKAADSLRGFGQIMERDFERSKAFKLSRQNLIDLIVSMNYDAKIFEDESLLDMPTKERKEYANEHLSGDDAKILRTLLLWKDEIKSDPKRRIITLQKGGKPVAYQVHSPDLYDALMHLDAASSQLFKDFTDHWLAKGLETINSAMKIGATSNLKFAVSNFIRDNLTAQVFSNSGGKFVPFWSSVAYGLLPALLKNKSPLYREWVSAGGYNSNFVGQTREIGMQKLLNNNKGLSGRIENLKLDFKQKPLRTALLAPIKVGIAPLQYLSEALESSTRIAEFKLMKDAYIENLGAQKWDSDKDARMFAANSSKQITLNFARKGSLGALANRYFAFFNAGLQGLSKMSELCPVDVPLALDYLCGDKNVKLKHLFDASAVEKLAVLFVRTAIIATLMDYFRPDNEDEIPEWKRVTCWNFDFGNGVVSIPKDLEAVPLYEIMERMMGGQRRNNYWQNMAQLIMPSLMPTFARPVVEHFSNYSFFRDMPLESRAVERFPKHLRSYATTSESAKWFCQTMYDKTGVEFSPIVFENYIQGLFATLGREALYWSDLAGSKLGFWQESIGGGWEGSPLNIASRFRLNPYAASESVSRFYDTKADADKLLNLEKMIIDGRAKISDLGKNDREKILWYNLNKSDINKVSRAFGEYNKEIKRVQEDESLSVEQKRALIKLHTKNKNDLAKRARALEFSREKLNKALSTQEAY